ncbi:MAG: hypothetical protein IPI67_37430 [Myxococcales bacterium]|nr:hypothetical protein [Myxococcales bacterium]
MRWISVGVLVFVSCGGGAKFKMVETPWSAGDDATARLTRGAAKLGCSASPPDSTGEIEISCPEGKPKAESEKGTLRIGPSAEDKKLFAMCNDGLAEGCSDTLKSIWDAGAR